jgi:hypothetical protein
VSFSLVPKLALCRAAVPPATLILRHHLPTHTPLSSPLSCTSFSPQTCAGLFYTFGIYAPLLKASYGLTQAGVQGLGAALLAGGYLALPGGWLYDAAQGHPAGPRWVEGQGRVGDGGWRAGQGRAGQGSS